MPTFASSLIPTGGAAATRAADVLPLPFPARPQVMTIYVRFIELGTILVNNAMVCHIGSSVATATPRLQFYAASGNYRLEHVAIVGSVSSTLTIAPSVGDLTELRAVLNADGSVQIHQSINSATETSAAQTAALLLRPSWASPTMLYVNSRSGTSNVGFNAFRNMFFHRGVQSLATMRRGAGVI